MTTLITGAHIYVEPGHFAQALLINDDGRIVAVGTEDEVKQKVTGSVKTWDAKGRTLVPGFNDTHMHLMSKGQLLASIQLLGCQSIAEVQARIRAFIEETKPEPGTVLYGMGWNQDYFNEDGNRLMTRDDVDAVTTDYPIILERACAHILVANTPAIELAGLTPESVPPEGGAYDVENGRLTGIVRENACPAILALRPEVTLEDRKRMIRLAIAHANRYGVTSVGTMDLRPADWMDTWRAYSEVLKETPYLRVNHQVNFMEPEGFKRFLSLGFKTGMGSDFNRIGPLKMFADGSLGARTALLRGPYADDPSTSGMATLSVEDLDTMVGLATAHQCQTIVHAIGDGAIERVLDAYEKVDPTHENPLRNGVVHVQITDKPLLERFQTQNVIAFTQPIFLHYDIQIAESRVGKAMASTSYAFKTLKTLGVHQSFGTDTPVEDLDPIACLYCAVNRKRLDGTPLSGFYPNECLSVEEAIDAYSLEGAYSTGDEATKGRLKEGYVADLVVLSENIFTLPPTDLLKTQVLGTMVNGQWVYEAEDL